MTNRHFFNRFTPTYVFFSVFRNLRRSTTIILAILIPVMLVTSLVMWLETAPRLAIQSAMDERAYEIEVEHTFYVKNAMDDLKVTLRQESLVEETYITQPTLFLYNLNDRSPYFDVLNYPAGEGDFYISEDLRNCVHLVDEGFLSDISPHIEADPGSNFSFSNEGIAISKRILRRIEEQTNQVLELGSSIDFAVATQLPDYELGESRLYYFQMIKFYNIPINAVFDRIPRRSLLFPYFYPETLGDGIFLSRNAVNQSMIQFMEQKIATPHLFVRMDRSKLAERGTFTMEYEIEALAFRIERENIWFSVDVYTDEINLIISNYERARIIILFLFIPLILVAFVFLLSTTSYMLGQRRFEIQLLRFKGASLPKIITLFSAEFSFLALMGFILGTLLGFIITWMISLSSGFLILVNFELNSRFISTVFKSWQSWILGGLFICLIYFLLTIQKVRSLLYQEQEESLLKSRSLKIRGLSRRNIDIGILIISVLTFIFATQSDIVNRLSLDPQLTGLYLAGATILWLSFGYGLARLSGDILPRLSRFTKIFRAKHKLITVSFVRKRPQVLSIITLITLTTSLVIFSIFYSQTLEHNTQKNIDYLIGSDFKVFTEESTIYYARELEQIPGVSSALAVSQTYGTIGRYTITLVGIDPETYFTSCYWSSKSVVAGEDPNQILSTLQENRNSGIIINDFLAQSLEISLNDEISMSRLFGTIGEVMNFKVLGVMKSAPGVGKMYSPILEVRGFSKIGGIALIHQDLMSQFLIQSTRVFLVKTNETSIGQRELVKNRLLEQSLVRQVYDRKQEHEIAYDFMQISGVSGILSADFIVALTVGIIGVSIFYNYMVSERLQEYAILRAFGGTKNQVFNIIILETIITVLFGIALGLLLGIGFVVGFILITRDIILSIENIFELELVASPLLIASVVIISFVILLASASLVATKARKVDTASLLRNL